MWKELREQPATDIARGETDFWVRTLGLSTEQADALQAINLRYASGMRVAARTSATDAAKLGALETLEDQKSEEILEILDPEQREKFTRFIEHRQRWVRK